MDLRTLRYFTVAAQELNITRAAQKLHMSQPPLSHQRSLCGASGGSSSPRRGPRCCAGRMSFLTSRKRPGRKSGR